MKTVYDMTGKKNVIVISGRAGETVIRASGQCTPPNGQPVNGRTFAFYLCGDKDFRPCYNRWMIVFALPRPGRYRATVIGYHADGSSVILFDTDITVRAAFAADIVSPTNNTPITDEKDDFTPYGDLTDNPLGTVQMTDGNNNVVIPIHTFGDYTDLQFWSAQFPSLATGTYSLQAEDSNQQGQMVTGLTV